MADQPARLEAATIKAEIGSGIVYRYANDAATDDDIPTLSGAIPNLKKEILRLQNEGAEKISFATKIFISTAAGIAGTSNQEIFLVQSNEPGEIYEVWQNVSGTAVDTGKRSISAAAVIEATEAATAAAASAQESADAATIRVARFLEPSATPPTQRDDGQPLEIGDRYLNTVDGAEYIYKESGWIANDLSSFTEFGLSLGAAKDAESAKTIINLENVDNTSDINKPVSTAQAEAINSVKIYVSTYELLRGYTGNSDVIYVCGRKNIFDGAHGFWAIHKTGTRPAEDGGTILHLDNGWWATRQFQGEVDPIWFGATRSNATPASTGEDISNAKWNAWPSFIDGAGYVNQPGHDWGDAAYLAANKPFKNTDTWDRIALQLAAWTMLPVKLQDGDYYLSAPLRWTNRMYNSMRGSSMFNARLRFNNVATHTRLGRVVPMIDVYRVAGPPLYFSDFGIIGPSGYIPQTNPELAAANVITGISCLNTNATHIERVWLGGGDIGVLTDTQCSDIFVEYCTGEYNGVNVAVGSGCAVTANNNNFWQSFGAVYPCAGVVGFGSIAGIALLNDNRFIGFSGRIVSDGPHRFSWNGGEVMAAATASTGQNIQMLSSLSSMKGVTLNLSKGGNSPVINLGSSTQFNACSVTARDVTHAIMNVGKGTTNSASYSSVTASTFDVTGTFIEGYLITSIVAGSAYIGGCTKCLFNGNVIVNQASTSLGWSGTNTIGTNQWA